MSSSRAFNYIKAGDKFSAIEEVISCCSLFSELPINRQEFCKLVLQRENLQSTYIGHGVLASHGKIKNLGKTKIALGLSKEGIAGPDGVDINFVFVIASDEESNMDYLKCLSALLSWIHEPVVREEILNNEESKISKNFLEMLLEQDFRVYCR